MGGSARLCVLPRSRDLCRRRPDTFPNVPIQIVGGESTLVEPSGVTFPNSFDIYDLSIIGAVNESDNNLFTIHQFNNGYISGTTTIDGLATFSGMTTSTTSPQFITLAAQQDITGSFLQSPIWVQGLLNLDNDGVVETPINKATASGYAINSTTTYSNVNIDGATIINTANNGGGIDVANGATSTFNDLSNFSILVQPGAPSLTAGSAATLACLFTTSDTNGAFVAPTGTNWQPCYDEKLNVLIGIDIAAYYDGSRVVIEPDCFKAFGA